MGGEKAKRYAGSRFPNKVSRELWPAGFGLQVLDTTEGVLGSTYVLPLPAGRGEILMAGRLNPVGVIRKGRAH
jgi:hypothetical protein